nr:formate--tetrahydrofolate ligase [Nitrospirota bacterium]
MTDLEIARSASPRPIEHIGAMLGLRPEDLIRYGHWKAKVAPSALERLADRPLGRYVLVTAINPTPLGEGKTTTSIGLAMALSRLGRRAVVTLDINLHFTGDAHAVASAHNLLSAFLDNHLFQGNGLNLDPARIVWPRALGISDRALRKIHLEGTDGSPGRDGEFVLTEASEVMAILALASGADDLRRRLGRILVGFTKEGTPVTAAQLKCTGAMAVLLRDALCPNLVQTIEGTPALVHTGPFGNIAHGNSSILADRLALRTADYVVTEAGFGSELGAEKFFNIKCRASGLRPDAAVIVATLRALKLHGGGGTVKAGAQLPLGLTGPNREALTKGLANLEQHLANVRAFGIPVVVAVNAFKDDPPDEVRSVRDWAISAGAVGAAVSTHFVDGGEGALELARTVEVACKAPSAYQPLYPDEAPIKQKIETVAKRLYGAAGVSYEPQAEAQIEQAVKLGFGRFPVCMAKTPLSLSHDAALKGRPTGFTLPIKELRILAGAGFLTAVCSGIQLMPGLPKHPAGERMDLDPETGEITGLS